MKRLFVLLLVVSFATFAKAQAVDPSLVPDVVKKNFAAKFPDVKGNTWTQNDPGFIETTFYQDKHKVVALYLMSEGAWISTDTYLKEEEYPQAAISWMKSNFPNGKITKLTRSETTKGTVYESELKTKEGLYRFTFDADGKLLTRNLEK